MSDVQELIADTTEIVDYLDFEDLAEFVAELEPVSFARTGSLSGTRRVVEEWLLSITLIQNAEWQRQMAESGHSVSSRA